MPVASNSDRTLRLKQELASARLLHQWLLAEEQLQLLEVKLRESLEMDTGFDPLVVQEEPGECEWQRLSVEESGVPRADTVKRRVPYYTEYGGHEPVVPFSRLVVPNT